MGKDKLRKFAETKTFTNVIQPTRDEIVNNFSYKGNWNKLFFKNSNPIVLELGCGKGEYSVGLAKFFPNKNFLGIDIKGARFWRGAKTALENGITNVGFLRTQIELIEHAFSPNEVSEIWITFPDPQIKYKRTKHRLINEEFLKKYKNIMSSEGNIHLKTDSEFLHGYANGLIHGLGLNIISSHHDIYGAPEYELPSYVRDIKTHYEKLFLKEGKPITYLNFKF
ncbi:tRNA (guanosine(46)-N7)-methyltransferase TrmB [Apibacter muscae]|uniref:tRNA (guanosine(46)-N7)-methyltransferase TrmB n=1 Tax=Apibacter muscae TaxID=2509004 RepID=UPI0011ADAB73|nr:tRNA (guanosine(46)-N7)-methyltransferase TrmB [Apibacter muscae]TWP23303.1 tRNA (guanosine(46)-N7)-methyltransferase TrmB [Apibacter muscae]